MQKNSACFFSNIECEYYPCHQEVKEFNCLFCYCPLYYNNPCPGNPSYKNFDDTIMKICTNCTYPHEAKNYENIIAFLKNKPYKSRVA